MRNFSNFLEEGDSAHAKIQNLHVPLSEVLEVVLVTRELLMTYDINPQYFLIKIHRLV